MGKIFALFSMIVSSFHEVYALWSFSLRIIPQPRLSSTYLGPNVPRATPIYCFPNCSCVYNYMSQTAKFSFERDYVTAPLLVPWCIPWNGEIRKEKSIKQSPWMSMWNFDRRSTAVRQLSSGTVINLICLPIGHRRYFSWSGLVAICCLHLIQNIKENWVFFATSVYVISGVGTEWSRGTPKIFKFLSAPFW